jgi:hypothetical protein
MMRLNSDWVNLLDSTQIATVFLDDALRIKHYTPAMEGLFSICDVDRAYFCATLSDLWRASAATASMATPASDAAVYMPTRPLCRCISPPRRVA